MIKLDRRARRHQVAIDALPSIYKSKKNIDAIAKVKLMFRQNP